LNTPETSPATLKRRFECPDAPEQKRQFLGHELNVNYNIDIDIHVNNNFVNNEVQNNIFDYSFILNENICVNDIDLCEDINNLIELIRLQIASLQSNVRFGTWKLRKNLDLLLYNVQNIKHLYEWNRTWNKYKIFNDFDEKEKRFRKAFEIQNKEFFENPKYAMPSTI